MPDVAPKDCGCPPHTDDRELSGRGVELDGDGVLVVSDVRCGRCRKDSTVKQPYDPIVHGPRVGRATVESYDEYAERTRADYAAEAARIRAELINLVSDAMLKGDPGSVQVGADIDGLAEIAVDTVAQFFATQQPFITTGEKP
jgi:hypothetical protein